MCSFPPAVSHFDAGGRGAFFPSHLISGRLWLCEEFGDWQKIYISPFFLREQAGLVFLPPQTTLFSFLPSSCCREVEIRSDYGKNVLVGAAGASELIPCCTARHRCCSSQWGHPHVSVQTTMLFPGGTSSGSPLRRQGIQPFSGQFPEETRSQGSW